MDRVMEMQEFKAFLATVRFAPNPFRQFDNTLSTNVPLPGQFVLGRGALPAGAPMPNGNAQVGMTLFRRQGLSGCIHCHTLPSGLGTDLRWTGSRWQPIPVSTNSSHHAAFSAVARSLLADLSEADLTGADLRFTVLNGADLSFALFHGTKIDTDTMISEKWRIVWEIMNEGASARVLTNADLGSATLTNANFRNANCASCVFVTSDLRNADFRGANLGEADLRWADLRGTQLDAQTVIDPRSRLASEILKHGAAGVDLHGTNLSQVSLIEADLRGANLTNCNFSQSILIRANLAQANLARANFDDAFLVSCVLTNANLTGAFLRRANLTEANLRGAITNGTDFRGAVFSETVMPDGTLRGN